MCVRGGLAAAVGSCNKLRVDDPSRYRIENGQPCIDVRVSGVEQLFDNRDPAPFRERDLDPDLVEYLLAAGDDLVGQPAYRVVFWLARPCQPGEVEAAVHAHFDYELDRLLRRRRRQRRTGQLALLLGIGIIVALLSLAQVVTTVIAGPVGVALREGLVISSWVVLWRPVEILIYDWIPVRRERRVLRRLLAAPIDVREGAGPEVKATVRHPAPSLGA